MGEAEYGCLGSEIVSLKSETLSLKSVTRAVLSVVCFAMHYAGKGTVDGPICVGGA